MLNVVAELRKCGIDSMLSLPQLVVCGDQSAGKSSVLEALTEIPFPRKENLCTRFATEIILRQSPQDGITIKVIPDDERPSNEQESIKAFKESIDDFSNLPDLMNKATKLIGLDDSSGSQARAFAKDVLSIEIEGPTRPQLTLVDLPGLIQTSTRGVTDEDLKLVAEITDSYIKKERTICLAVISAANDYANQGILKRVRKVDPKGERTLGIITKPDRLPRGSESEQAYFKLAKNEDISFRLGWHVLRNRAFEDGDSSFQARNATEITWFRNSIFSRLGKSNVGISTLRERLSTLLFNHVKKELPKLRADLEKALAEASHDLKSLGTSRATAAECRAYLTDTSLEVHGLCTAAINGHYEGDYFISKTKGSPLSNQTIPIRRLRAIIQALNSGFSHVLRTTGHKFHVKLPTEEDDSSRVSDLDAPADENSDEDSAPAPNSHNNSTKGSDKDLDLDFDDETSASDTNGNRAAESSFHNKYPQVLKHSDALKWAGQVLNRTRGKELPGNFNPLLIGELFWEQSERWEAMTQDYVELVASRCRQFFRELLFHTCSKDVAKELWSSRIEDAFAARTTEATEELAKIMEDIKSYPITYNHYYTDTLSKRRGDRNVRSLERSIEEATSYRKLDGCNSTHTSAVINAEKAARDYVKKVEPDMVKFSCQEALDCLFAIYKVR